MTAQLVQALLTWLHGPITEAAGRGFIAILWGQAHFLHAPNVLKDLCVCVCVGTHLARLGLAPLAPGDAARFFFSFLRVQAVKPDLLEGPNFEAVELPLGGFTQAAHLADGLQPQC